MRNFVILFLITVLGSKAQEISIVPVDSVKWFEEENKDLTFASNQADSLLNCINNENIKVSLASDNTVVLFVELGEKQYIITNISQSYSARLLSEFNDHNLDWSRCLLLYFIYQRNAIHLQKYFSNHHYWRTESMLQDFYNLYFLSTKNRL